MLTGSLLQSSGAETAKALDPYFTPPLKPYLSTFQTRLIRWAFGCSRHDHPLQNHIDSQKDFHLVLKLKMSVGCKMISNMGNKIDVNQCLKNSANDYTTMIWSLQNNITFYWSQKYKYHFTYLTPYKNASKIYITLLHKNLPLMYNVQFQIESIPTPRKVIGKS